MSNQMGRREVAELLLALLERVEPRLVASEVSLSDSLTGELGLDSLRLSELFELIRDEVGELELMPWFMDAAQGGDDSVDSMVTFLLDNASAKLAARRSMGQGAVDSK